MQYSRLFTPLLVLIGAVLFLVLIFAQGIADTPANKEAPLNPDGLVYEMSRDDNGKLWITDYMENEIWKVDPATGNYTVYDGLYGASDGRLDSSGYLWWSNFDEGQLGRLIPGAAQATLWSLPPDSNPLGITFDNNGHVWVADGFEPFLYRFDPSSKELCTYTVPDSDPIFDGASDYILYHNGQIWIGDLELGRILRLNPATNTFTIWKLAADALPEGLAIDNNGHLWWADNWLGELGRLDSQSNPNQITSYVIPSRGIGPAPIQVAVQNGKVWYTDETGHVGSLDPAVANGTTVNVSPSTEMEPPTCESAGTEALADVTTSNGTFEWTSTDYTLAHNSGGWMIYRLPEGAAPYGLATSGSSTWFADQGDDAAPIDPAARAQQLGWLDVTQDPGSKIFLPAVLRP